MDMFWIRVISQGGIYITFVLYLLWSFKCGASIWIPFLGTIIYALVFEHFNMLRYAHAVGGYSYHPKSWLFLWGDVPLYIPLAWAFIVATSRTLTDRLRLKTWSKPFADALLALLIDLSLDVVAIRLGFWSWRGIASSEGFFGVPADNFLGWLLVTFTFSALTRWLWHYPSEERRLLARRALVQWFVVPPIAYISYLGMEALVHFTYLLHIGTRQTQMRAQLVVLAGVLGLFLALVLAGRSRTGAEFADDEDNKVSLPHTRMEMAALHAPRHIFHLFGLVGLLFIPAPTRHPTLWVVTLSVWALELYVAWIARAH